MNYPTVESADEVLLGLVRNWKRLSIEQQKYLAEYVILRALPTTTTAPFIPVCGSDFCWLVDETAPEDSYGATCPHIDCCRWAFGLR